MLTPTEFPGLSGIIHEITGGPVRPPWSKDPHEGRVWVCTLIHRVPTTTVGVTVTADAFLYYTGSAITETPTVEDVCYALALDLSYADAEEWDTNELGGVRAYLATQAQADRVRALFGDRLPEFTAWAEELDR